MPFAFGVKRRTSLALALPHWSATRALLGPTAWADPGAVDYSAKLSADIGMMLNDNLGDCVIAAGYHFIQTATSWARGVEITEPDTKIVEAYSEITGYNPADPNTDRGTEPDAFFRFAIATGLPIEPSPAPRVRHKFIAGWEIDYRNTADVREAIDLCGAVFVAFTVPNSWNSSDPPKVWDDDGSGPSNEGHMVLVPGFNADGNFVVESWGRRDYQITPKFLEKFCQQVNSVADPSWIEATGKTPFNMTVEQLAAAMAAIGKATTL